MDLRRHTVKNNPLSEKDLLKSRIKIFFVIDSLEIDRSLQDIGW